MRPVPEPALAHIGHLFVEPPFWGSGIAGLLLAHAETHALARGFTSMRLYVPVGQARARRFYARHEFAVVGGPLDLGNGLPLLECRHELAPAPDP